MTSAEFSVRQPSDLAALSSWRQRRGIRRINVDAALMTGRQLERLNTAINRDLRACGCIEGAVFCAAALLSLPWLGATLWSQLPGSSAAVAAIGFGYAALAALAGKIFGVALAEWRLSRNLRSLADLLREGPAASAKLD